jgi:hypothetical protein
MTIRGDILAETGLDLTNPKLIDEPDIGLAQMFADRLSIAFPFPEVLGLVKQVMTAYRGLTVAAKPLAVYAAALAAIQAAASIFEGRLDDDISENFQHIENARHATAATYLRSGDWSIVVPAGGVKVGTVDMYDQAGGWGPHQFRAQYNPGIVWLSKRTAKSDILLPTWPTPPYTSGFGFEGVLNPEPLNSPLTGFMCNLNGIPNIRPTPKGWTTGKYLSGQPTCAPIPPQFEHVYFGNMPAVSPEELAELQGPVTGRLKALKRIINKMDAAFYKTPLVPPPDYYYLFSVGTYPYTSWGTGDHAGLGSYVTFNATMAAMAMAIHSLTPMHAAIDARKVAQCYRAWLAATRLRSLPPLPKHQIGDEIYLDAEGLPYALNPRTHLPCVTALRPGEKQDLQLKAGKGAPLALGTAWSKYELPVEVVRAVELSFRSFFRIRRAALYQLDLATPNFRDAAAKSPDPELSAAAKGKPPPYRAWRAEDPLGDGWRPGEAGTASLDFGPYGYVGEAGLVPPRGGAGIGGALAAGGLGYGLYRWLTRQR